MRRKFPVHRFLVLLPFLWTVAAAQSEPSTRPPSSAALRVRALVVNYEEWLAAPGRETTLSSRQKLAIRADWSTAREWTVFFPNRAGILSHGREVSFANGDRVRIDERLRLVTAIRTPLVFSDDLPLLTAESNCCSDFNGAHLHEFSDGGERLLGFRIVKETRSSSHSRITIWRSPELGCVQLRRLAEFLDSSAKVTDTSDLRAVLVELGEPEGLLFAVPTDFEHVSYSEHMSRVAQAAGRKLGTADLAPFRQQDAAWEKHRINDLSAAGKTPRRSRGDF